MVQMSHPVCVVRGCAVQMSGPAMDQVLACVPLSLVCDNHPDCQDGEDETVCTTTCLDLRDENICINEKVSKVNSMLSKNTNKVTLPDYLSWPPVCYQACISTAGGYKCDCLEGYTKVGKMSEAKKFKS